MPETISDPDTRSVDIFMEQVIQGVHRQEARARGPFSYGLSTTAWFTGLPVPLLRRLCRDTELQAIKLSGRWLLHRDDFNRLLAPDVTLRCRTARQYILIRNLEQLAAMLYPHEASSTLHVLLHDLRRAVMFRQAGACYEDAEGMVWARAEWRIRDGIVDREQIDEALGLLQISIELGMELLRNIDWRQDRLVSMIAEQTGVDLGSGHNSSLPIDAAHDCPIGLSFAV